MFFLVVVLASDSGHKTEGMVNPTVLENCNVDTKIYQGFAFGMGLDRITMLKYGLTDIRSFFSRNLNWIANNGFSIGDY